MENASKALLMAAGILITMLILMLLVFFKGKIVEFYDNQETIEDIANVAEFNKQFTNYDRKKVYGYEIISLANMIEDYNTRHSNVGANDDGYKPITLNVVFPAGEDVKNKIWYDDAYSHLFKDNDTLTQSNTQNEIVGRIMNQTTGIERLYGNTDIATKLAKSIKTLVVDGDDRYQIDSLMSNNKMTEAEAINRLQLEAVATYKSIINSQEDITYSEMINNLFSIANIKQYYEYYQFKKAIFKCTSIKYYNEVGDTGRVEEMNFEFTGDVE